MPVENPLRGCQRGQAARHCHERRHRTALSSGTRSNIAVAKPLSASGRLRSINVFTASVSSPTA
jgi:hypothetical protein